MQTTSSKIGRRKVSTRNWSTLALVVSLLAGIVQASENVPHRPFAMWADVPLPGQFIVGLVYEESEAYHFWAGHDDNNVRFKAGGESYGIDINQGYLALQYGLTEMGAGPERGWNDCRMALLFKRRN